MAKLILTGNPGILPKYLENAMVDVSCLYKNPKILSKKSHPIHAPFPGESGGSDQLLPDPYQMKAIRHMLSHELAIVQGPPGTGKTFIGVKVVQILHSLLSKKHLGPILVICYTNHALDRKKKIFLIYF